MTHKTGHVAVAEYRHFSLALSLSPSLSLSLSFSAQPASLRISPHARLITLTQPNTNEVITAENCARTNQQLWCAARRLPTRCSRGCCATTCFCVSNTHLTQAERERRSNDEHVEQRGGGQRAVETPEAILREDTHTLISLFSLSSLFPSLHYSLSSSLSSLDLLSLICSLSLLSSLSFLFSLFSRFFSVSHLLILSFSHSLILSFSHSLSLARHARAVMQLLTLIAEGSAPTR